jgi:hypothetical protein
MTHSLHRRGTTESLKDDYVLLITAASGINHEGSQQNMSRILDIVLEAKPCNIGAYNSGTILSGVDIEDIKAWCLVKVPRIRCCFNSGAVVEEVIRKVKEVDSGLSVTVQGPIDDLHAMNGRLGIKPHSINLSLNIWGREGELPSEDILEFVTMCGHGLISAELVKKAIAQVKAGKKTPQQAANMLSHPCVSGIFNPERASVLFEKYVPLLKEA